MEYEGIATLLSSVSILVVALTATYFIYNVYFHPLSKYPGPLLWRAARLPYMKAAWSGRFPYVVQQLHEKYGEVVRIAPNELSFATLAAWEDIYSKHGRGPFPKSELWHGSFDGSEESVFVKRNLKEHGRTRRAMDPGFTEGAVLRQEPLVQRYVDLWIEKLDERIQREGRNETVISVIEWLNFPVFDIIGDLVFGESFGCLDDSKPHEWMSFMFNAVKHNYLLISLRHYPPLVSLLMSLIPASVREKQKKNMDFAATKTNRRLQLNTKRPDIISMMQRKLGTSKDGLSDGEINANTPLLIIAGSETTVTVLTGVVNQLVQNAASQEAMSAELRQRFSRPEDLTFSALKDLPYLNAVINEGLRMFNPNPIGHMRISPPQGGTVGGYFVPGKTFVTIHPQTIMYSNKFFREPHAWRPERWLDAAKSDPQSPYFEDERRSVRAFGVGQHSCIGEPLAWAEMRVLLAKLLWSFDLKKSGTANEEVIWGSQKVFGIVEKLPLDIKLVRREQ